MWRAILVYVHMHDTTSSDGNGEVWTHHGCLPLTWQPTTASPPHTAIDLQHMEKCAWYVMTAILLVHAGSSELGGKTLNWLNYTVPEFTTSGPGNFPQIYYTLRYHSCMHAPDACYMTVQYVLTEVQTDLPKLLVIAKLLVYMVISMKQHTKEWHVRARMMLLYSIISGNAYMLHHCHAACMLHVYTPNHMLWLQIS